VRRLVFAAALLVVILVVGGFWVTRATAREATPATAGAGGGEMTLVLVEHSENATDVDVDGNGPSVGDLRVWGPNPLFDEADTADTGARTQGACVALNADFDCVLTETIIFPDGSTLQFQGVERGTEHSERTIVGGSGQYLGAVGVMQVEPTDDLFLWTKTITYSLR
jgi:hypothetical protein